MTATAKKTAPQSFCFPQEKPATQQELTQHIKKAERYSYSLTLEEHTQDIEQWLKNL